MNIEEAIGMSAAQLAAMTNEDLEKHFGALLPLTRPEQAPRQQQKEQLILKSNPQFEKARQVAASVGIQLPVFQSMKKRK